MMVSGCTRRPLRREGAPLRILIYGLNFSPELTGIGKYTGEMAWWLAHRGHQVQVVTTPPYYPEWRLGQGFSNRYQTEHLLPNLTVHRCPFYVPTKPSGIKRLLHLSSFAVSSFLPMLRSSGWEPDILLNVEPTFFSAPVALLAARLAESPAWLHVQDFEIDAAFDLGLLPSGGVLQRLALGVEKRLTRQFDCLSSISPRMAERAIAKGVPSSRVVLFPNWVDPAVIYPEPPSHPNSFRQQLGLEGKLVLLYSGNMGNKQGLECLAQLATQLRSNPDVHCLFCGDGAFRPELELLVAGLPNVTFLPLQMPDRLNELLNLAALHLLPQKVGVMDLVMPSKLTGMLASGRPVLAMAAPGTQLAEVVSGCSATGQQRHDPCGVVVSPQDLGGFVQVARALLADAGLRARLGAGARTYAVRYLAQQQVLERFERQLAQVAGQGTSTFR